MKINIGSADRVIRVITAIGIGILYLFHLITGTLAIAPLIFMGIFLITSIISFSPCTCLSELQLERVIFLKYK